MEVDLNVELSNKNLMHVIVTKKSNQKVWDVAFVYGCHLRDGSGIVWNYIRHIAWSESLPWLCMGDFNQILGVSDKIGGLISNQNAITSFHELISDCGLVDLEFKGPKFTWRNNQSGESFIMERIDMAFANAKWREMHDKAMMFVEPAIGFDHKPLLLNTEVPLNKVGKPFKFESFWVTEDGCQEVIANSWNQHQNGSSMFSVCRKLKLCKENLKVWSNQTVGVLRHKIDVTKEKLIEVQR
ncbi:hypothetical protein Vadar_014192 [Vaccinium darrowii]|uniref:Uncharacterized protein n=1 Tax=Vaccinium darrowii TaxID=229202 RepID=A0ACB7X0R8_9ERIC|nr:hypothetical protein Vadar_014192 [Vaccinium darrowii]